jgi:hypothetical protein
MAKNSEDKMVEVEVLRDFWGEPNEDGTENRCTAGSILEVKIEDALTLIEAGSVKRVKKSD